MGGGQLSDKEQLTVVFAVDGPMEEAKFTQFNQDLRTLMQKYGVTKLNEMKWKR
jgi:hypothetical protein